MSIRTSLIALASLTVATGLITSVAQATAPTAAPAMVRLSERNQALEVGVLGDVEGIKPRLDSFVAQSGLFNANAHGGYDLRDGKAFVFQGDVEDRGDAGREITAFLLDMKQRYPERVTLILGNRDLQKLSIVSRLAPAALAEPDGDFDQWLREEKNLDPHQYHMSPELKFIYLAWGAEMRWEELKKTNPNADLPEVVASYIEDLKPNGLFGKYLQAAQFGFIDRSTKTIFVHGAIRAANAGRIPWAPVRFKRPGDWIKYLNESGNALIQKALGGDVTAARELIRSASMGDKSVVSARFFDGNGSPELPEAEVIKWLETEDLHRISVGHTPAGEVPAIVFKDGFQVLMADLSFNRSKVTPTILLNGPALSSKAIGPDGQDVHINLKDFSDTTVVGRHIGSQLIVGETGSNVLLYEIGPRFKRLYSTLSKTEAATRTHPTCKAVFSGSNP